MILVQTKNAPGAKNEGDVAPEALPRRSKAVVSPHILLTNNPTDPSPCHQPWCPQPSLLHPSLPLMSSGKFSQAPAQVIEFLDTGLSWGRPSTAPGGRLLRRRRQESLGTRTHGPPPSLPPLPGERWQLANTALYICSKHPFQVLSECKKAYFKKIGSKHKHQLTTPNQERRMADFFGPKLKPR